MRGNQKIELRELIKASAGSGKTYQLTDRFLFLLLLDFKPESIVALTFSRKAAGEFFDAILQKLAKAAKEPSSRQELEKKFGFEITPIRLRGKISELLRVMNRLTLGTLDSFFFSILSSAPLEYGLAVGFDLMDAASIREKWFSCLKQCFEENTKDSRPMIDAFSKARTEAEDRTFFSWMLELSISFRDLLSQCPNPKDWGDIEHLWPNNSPWKQIPEGYDLSIDCANCRDWLREGKVTVQPELTEKMNEVLSDSLLDFEEWKPGKDMEKMSTGFKRLLKASVSESGSFALNFYRKNYEFSGDWVAAVRRMSAFIIGEELKIHGIRTQGIYSLLTKVVNSYRKQVLEKGGITFSDLPLLLSNKENELAQLNREYRMDRKYQHWMLDEFQDTSPSQWAVIEPLVEEVINDPEDRRMFFCVGDQKQAIYGWRGGDSRLFGHLEQHFKERLKIENMNLSWRSGKDILTTINQVFGTTFDSKLMIPRWVENWRLHLASPKTADLTGNVSWWTSKSEDERFHAIAHLLRTIDPVARGWSCAILTQKRKTARAVVDFLRCELPGMPVEEEVGSLPAEDNGFSQFLLSLLQASIHPTDMWAVGHLKLCPFIDHISGSLDELLEEVRSLVYEQGVAPFVKEWGRRAMKSVVAEARPFATKRMHETLSLALTFDQSGTRNIDLFIEAARNTETSKGATESSIRAMTIHGSKGLTFDIVIMPELGGDGLRSTGGFSSGDGVELYRKSSSTGIGFDWVLSKPKKIIQQSDPYFSRLMTEDEEEAAFENLCKFYVGMTRPARGLYLFSEPYSARSKSKNFVYLLAQTLGAIHREEEDFIQQCNQLVGERGEGFKLAYCVGSPEWWMEKSKTSILEKERNLYSPEIRRERRFRSIPRIRPSDKNSDKVKVTDLVQKNQGVGKRLGSEVHGLFEKVEWWENKTSIKQWLMENGSQYSKQAQGVFIRALSNQKGEALFCRPAEKVEVWRERSFAMYEEGVLLQGIFDRVVLYFSEDGILEGAEIIDIKTDRLPKDLELEDLVNVHRKQLEYYRVALQALTELPVERIKMILFFTSLVEVHQL